MQGGLQNSSVHRLAATKEKAGKLAAYTDLSALISSDGKYKAYRKHFKSITPPTIPYLGVFLTDLTFIEDTNKDHIGEDKKVNFLKCTMLADVIRTIYDCQRTPFNLIPIEPIQGNLVSSCPGFLGHLSERLLPDAELWKLSQEAEPSKN